MKSVVLAYHTMGCVGIEALLRNGFEVAAVFTHRDDPSENAWFRSVAELATSLGIPVFAPDDINHPIWVEKIHKLLPDVLFSFYYRTLIREPILKIPRAGCLNLHGSLLPKYRGRCPVNWVLVNGERQTGVTLHFMTPRADDGDIVGQTKIPIEPDDTALTLHQKSAEAASLLLDRVLPAIKSGRAPRVPQREEEATYNGGRSAEDGEIDWTATAGRVRDLVRAVTRPYPGAFSHAGKRRCTFWSVTSVPEKAAGAHPGTVTSLAPLIIACREGSIRVDSGQHDKGVCTTGAQLAQDLGLVRGMRFGAPANEVDATRRKKILILGANGFIGNALTRYLLATKAYEVHALDLRSNHIDELLTHPDCHFTEGDISIHREWIEYHVSKCDVVLPLVAIATPIEYTRDPLRVFELDFEENLRVVRYCVKYSKRLVFPSTSEVYGMCEDQEFNEETSNLVLGPIRMQRWIYSCCKQLLDRVIWAYGQKEGLKFTLFRPFNWIGPRLDSLDSARIGSSRVVTRLILDLVEGTPIQLVDGGEQQRCFTDVSDGVECLYRIIDNKGGHSDGRIINIGNPENVVSIRQLAEMLVEQFERHPLRDRFPPFAGFQRVESGAFYGPGYQDMQYRKPSIRNAQRLLNWTPTIRLETSLEETLDFFLRSELRAAVESAGTPTPRPTPERVRTTDTVVA